MDARTRYTKNVIEEQFLILLSKNPLSKITVKKICENAEINRATFYKYYENPYDLLNKIEQKKLDLLLERINKTETKSLGEIFKIILTEIHENFSLYKTLFSENGDKSFRKKIFSYCYEENISIIQNMLPNISYDKQELLYYFIAEGCNGILNKWMENGMENSPEDLIIFTEKIISCLNKNLTSVFL